MALFSKKSLYLTTTLPYVNAEPHIGFALEIVEADIIARFKKSEGFDVFFNTGTDEHGQKIYEKAKKEGKEIQTYVDEYALKFKNLKSLLNLSDNLRFIRTTDSSHIRAAQEFWKLCDKNGDIYKKLYKTKYCVGCELEKTDSDLEDGKCPFHPQNILEIREEENYFFRFSKYQKPLLALYKKNPDFVLPASRLNEITKFVERGLEDFSISRLKEKMPWGVPVPNDSAHVFYVWFDALVNYISTLGWPEDKNNFKKYWTKGIPVQFCGKDNLRQQSAMWQAMLFSAGLPNSKQIVVHGFITSGGQKMSKSLGNVISPEKIVQEYGTEALRYYLARHVHPFEDSDFTEAHFKEVYNANLANGLGNLVSRILKMSETNLESIPELQEKKFPADFKSQMEKFNIQEAANFIWQEISALDTYIQETQPFKLVKTDPKSAKKIIKDLVRRLYNIAVILFPIMPETSETIKKLIRENKMPDKPLFLRKE